MQTRRELLGHFLQQGLVLPLAIRTALPACATTYCVAAGRDCLSQESAAGYRSVLGIERLSASEEDATVVIATGVDPLSEDRLRRWQARVQRGAWLIWESKAYGRDDTAAVAARFGLSVDTRISTAGGYVEYCWPARALVRSFSTALPVDCWPGEAIAQFKGRTIGMRRQLGHGGIIFLGSMLGPQLRAGDREAQELFRSLGRAYAGTSTRA